MTTKTIPSEPHKVSEPMNELEYYRALQQAQGQLAELKKDLKTRDDQLTEARRQTRGVEIVLEGLKRQVRETAREAVRQGRPDDLRAGLKKIITLCWGPE